MSPQKGGVEVTHGVCLFLKSGRRSCPPILKSAHQINLFTLDHHNKNKE
jgi:hypothetical protein